MSEAVPSGLQYRGIEIVESGAVIVQIGAKPATKTPLYRATVHEVTIHGTVEEIREKIDRMLGSAALKALPLAGGE